MWQLNTIKYGVKPTDRMDKTHFEVIDVSIYRDEKS